MSIVKIPAPTYVAVVNLPTERHPLHDKLFDAAKTILDAFCWPDTAEGDEFWCGVYDRLVQIAEDGKLK